jgi:hypothetical protein
MQKTPGGQRLVIGPRFYLDGMEWNAEGRWGLKARASLQKTRFFCCSEFRIQNSESPRAEKFLASAVFRKWKFGNSEF